MAEQDSSETVRLLKLIARLMAHQIAGSMTLSQGVPILTRLGMDANEIAKVLNTTPNAVRARLGEAKRKKPKGAGLPS